jgi:hypothetical protein
MNKKSNQILKPKRGADGKYGFIDKTGEEIIPCKYDYAGTFYDIKYWMGSQLKEEV